MKKYAMVLGLFCLMTRMSLAQTINVADVEAVAGETVSFSMSLTDGKADTYTSLQFNATFPKTGFKTTGRYAISEQWPGASATVGDVDSDGLAIIPVSSAEAISGCNTEKLLTVYFTVDEDVALGEYLVTLSRITFGYGFTDKDVAPDVTFKVNVVSTHTIELDESSTTLPETAEDVNVRVLRTIKADEWSTICLPFSMTEEQVKSAFGEGVELADFSSWSSEEDDDGNIIAISVGFTDVAEIEANHPYIIKVKQTITEFTAEDVDIDAEEEPSVMVGKKKAERGYMIGNYIAGTAVPEDDLFLNANKFWYSKGASTMKAFRAYFEFADVLTDVEGANARILMSFFGDEATGISSLTPTPMREERIYSLSGMEVTGKRLGKGLYIRNGMKIVIK